MIFLNKLYDIESAERTDAGVAYTVRLHAEHPIYRGHFPGEPVTPGVCILQMALELLSDAVGESLALGGLQNVKFLQILRPEGMPVRVDISRIERSGGEVKAQVDVSAADAMVAKISLTCRKIAE